MDNADFSGPEFSRPIDRRAITAAPVVIEASETECAALARRFAIASVKSLSATLDLVPDGAVIDASGRLRASIVQSCAISGEDLPVEINAKLTFRFVPERDFVPQEPDVELELDEDDCDEIPYAGSAFDLGEAVAQSLALAIDPYLTGPNADRVREDVGLDEPERVGPFAVLAGLKGKG